MSAYNCGQLRDSHFSASSTIQKERHSFFYSLSLSPSLTQKDRRPISTRAFITSENAAETAVTVLHCFIFNRWLHSTGTFDSCCCSCYSCGYFLSCSLFFLLLFSLDFSCLLSSSVSFLSDLALAEAIVNSQATCVFVFSSSLLLLLLLCLTGSYDFTSSAGSRTSRLKLSLSFTFLQVRARN